MAIPAGITGAAWLLRTVIDARDLTTEVAMVYLAGVLLVASRRSWGPAVAAVLASVATYNFFFVPPFYTFHVADPKFLITFGVMLAVGLTVSTLAVRLQRQADSARERERRTAALFAMTREFAVETSADEVARTLAAHARTLLDCEAQVLMPGPNGDLHPCPSGAPAVDDNELPAAQWAFHYHKPAGHGTPTLPGSSHLWLPLLGARGPLGVLGVQLSARGASLAPSQRELLETYVAQAGLALERVVLAEESARATVAAETERTRSALLSAISHDVRTPLASISGAAATLLEDRASVDESTRRELLQTIWDESESLARLVADLLDLTRLETGTLVARKEPCPMEEIIASAMERMERRLAGRQVRTDLPDEVVVAPVDPVLMEQVLGELLENAVRYSPDTSPIDVVLRREGDLVALQVEDRGPGIAPGEEEAIFDRFYRGAGSAGARGTGLGLTVCRAIVHAHAGRISASNRAAGGAVFRVEIPADAGPGTDRLSPAGAAL